MLKLNIDTPFFLLKSKFEYIIEVFNTIYHVPSDLTIRYGKDGFSSIQISPGDAVKFFQSNQTVPNEIVWIEWLKTKIPIFFCRNNHFIMIDSDKNDNVIINYDILASAFYLLSCWQEWKSNHKDEWGRFLFSESILLKLNIICIPVVNYYFDILSEAVKRSIGEKPVIRFQNNHDFIAIVTHDIDQCKTGWRENSFREFVSGHFLRSLKTIYKRLVDKDVWFNFDDIISLERNLGISSSFYFMANNKPSKNQLNADYDIKSNQIKSVMDKIISNGHEIGVHGSLGTGWNIRQLKEEIRSFPISVTGGRFHFLAMEISKSFDVMNQSGLKYDMSLGFAEHIGFRSSFCFPYNPYNIEQDCSYNFIEFPLMVMDRTVSNKNYMAMTKQEALNAIINLIAEVQKFNGLFILLWHNKFFGGFKTRGWREIFEKIISEIYYRNGVFSKPKDLINKYSIV